jgi:hypothetical protein
MNEILIRDEGGKAGERKSLLGGGRRGLVLSRVEGRRMMRDEFAHPVFLCL